MKTCVEHSWDCWHRYSQGDTYDPTKGEFVYQRECQMMGCTAVQRANVLEPVDPVVVYL